MSHGYKSALEVAIDDIRDDISDMKDVLKGLTVAIGALAVQEERQARMRQDIDKIGSSVDTQWKIIRSIQDTCNTRQRHVDYAERLMAKPDAQAWWNSKITGATEKMLLMLAGAIASAVGYQFYQIIVEVIRR